MMSTTAYIVSLTQEFYNMLCVYTELAVSLSPSTKESSPLLNLAESGTHLPVPNGYRKKAAHGS